MSKRKTKVLFVADCSTSSVQAQDRDARNFALFLDPERFDVWIFCMGDADIRLKNKDNVRIVYLNSRLKIAKVIKAFAFYCLKRYHLVMFSRFSLTNLFKIATHLPNRKGITVGIVNQVPYHHKNFKYLVRGPHHVFAISSRIREGIKNYANRDVPVIHLCYDLDMFRPKAHQNIRKQVVCVGSMQLRKQPLLFANIARRTPEADFIWVGDGYYMNWMKEKIKNEGISNLKIPGVMKQSDLADFLPQCDIFLFPSVHEGFPNVIVEAMACGLPVVAFNTYGPEAVIDGETGYIVKSEFEMLEKLKYLISDDVVLKAFSKNARRRAMDFEGSNIIHELEDFIEKCVLEDKYGIRR